jgi:hypothetical protein
MRVILNILIAVVVGAVLFVAAAERSASQPYADDSDNGATGLFGLPKTGFSLLDPDRLSISQSYTFSYYSGGGRSGSIGMLMNSIEYRVSNPLKITLDIGVLHNPSAIVSRTGNGFSPTMVPGFKLQYRPSEKFFFQVDIRSYPAYYYGNPHSGYYWGSENYWNR